MKFPCVFLLSLIVLTTCIVIVHPEEPETLLQQETFLHLSLHAVMIGGTSRGAMNTKMGLLFQAIESLPIKQWKNYQTDKDNCLNAFTATTNTNYFDLRSFPEICSKTVREMIKTITPKLNYPTNVEEFMDKTRKRLVSKTPTESIVEEFAHEIITQTVKNPKTTTPDYLHCILGRLKELYSEMKYSASDPTHIAGVIATEIRDILHGFRVESTETEHAYLS